MAARDRLWSFVAECRTTRVDPAAVIRFLVEGRELGPEMAFDKLRVRFCQRALPGQALASPDGRLFVRSKAVDLDDEPVAQRRGLIGRQLRLR
jgi:hypothetical protein